MRISDWSSDVCSSDLVKAVPDTVTAAFGEFMEAFETFKDVNDRRLGEIEEKLTSDVVTRDRMDRIGRAMDEQKTLLDQMLVKKDRKRVVEGKSVSVRVDLGCRSIITKKKANTT